MTEPALDIRGLNVFYGQSHALQGVDLTLTKGVLSVVGRNGMGKTTLCKAIMGLEPAAGGSITFHGRSLVGLPTAEVARLGVGYVPQGRRLWRSLTVDEHLRLVATKGGAWTPERIYSTFPRLAERRTNGGAQLSGGEQQMLAIGRALLLNPRLLVMDEPTEGLAPVIVSQVEEMLARLGEEGDIDVLVIEQNIGVACAVSEDVAIMVNGKIDRIISSAALAADRDLQQAMLGVGRHAHDEVPEVSSSKKPVEAVAREAPRLVYISNPVAPTRWSRPVSVREIEGAAKTLTLVHSNDLFRPVAPQTRSGRGTIYVVGTLDTKRAELTYMRDLIKDQGLPVSMIDLSTTGGNSGAEVPAHVVAACHWMSMQSNVGGVIAAGGSGGTALVAPAFRALPVGVPKVIVSTVASGNTEQYVGPADILMLHSVADVQGINSITREVLRNGAAALAGMAMSRAAAVEVHDDKPAVGLTMFGVTTPCVQAVVAALEDAYDCLVFHATGTGGRAMEKLLDDEIALRT